MVSWQTQKLCLCVYNIYSRENQRKALEAKYFVYGVDIKVGQSPLSMTAKVSKVSQHLGKIHEQSNLSCHTQKEAH